LLRRQLLIGAASALALQAFGRGIAATAKSSPSSEALVFRKAQGKVAAFFYGAWTQYGNARNPAPWLWINRGFEGRLPTSSVLLPGHWLGWAFAEDDLQYSRVGSPGSARAVNASLKANGRSMLFRPAKTGAAIISPDFHAGRGADFPGIRFVVERPARQPWSAAISFKTKEGGGRTSRIEVPEPRWEAGAQAVTIDMTPNADWMEGNITQVSIELGRPGDEPYLLHGRFELLPSPRLAKELASIRGLPQDQGWAADWQLKQAAAHGIDAFFMCTFWDGEKAHNKSVTDAMFASPAAPSLQLGLYFDSLASRKPSTLAEFDRMLEYWNRYFSETRFWRIDGRPVLGWHGAESTRDFLSNVPEFKTLSPSDRLAQMVRYIQNFYRSRPDSNARRGVYLVTGFMVDNKYWSGSKGGPSGVWDQAGFDAGTVYNQFRNNSTPTAHTVSSRVGPATAQSFSQLNGVYNQAADWVANQSGSRLRYFEPAIAGWDSRPWSTVYPRADPACSPAWQCTPDAPSFLKHLDEVRNRAMNRSRQTRLTPIVMVNAWDEFGEGGFICPTTALGAGRLQAIQQIFGIAAG